jgi:serine/threonine-protein kinase HipA
LAAYELGGLNKKILDNTLELFEYAKPEMLEVLNKSFVSDAFKTKYSHLIGERYKQLGLS